MDIWLLVEERRHRLGLSVNAFCKQAEFVWVMIGLRNDDPSKENMPELDKMISGKTLQRRYEEAVSYMKDGSELYIAELNPGKDTPRLLSRHIFAKANYYVIPRPVGLN